MLENGIQGQDMQFEGQVTKFVNQVSRTQQAKSDIPNDCKTTKRMCSDNMVSSGQRKRSPITRTIRFS
jgi:hypothetical protein